MKKFLIPITLIIALILIATPIFIKNPSKLPSTPDDKTSVSIASLKGPTSISLLKLMSDNETKTAINNYNFLTTGTPDEITAKLVKKELDIAIIPCNLASVLYNNRSIDISILAVNNLNVLYILENGNTINNISDLEGKTIYMTGKGTIPEYTINALLKTAGIENKVTIEYKTEPAEIVSILKEERANIAVLQEPYVSTAINQNNNLRVALNLGEEFKKQTNNIEIVTAVAIARKEFINENKEAVDNFLEEYKNSIEYVNNNGEEASKLSEKFNIIPFKIENNTISLCNIKYIAGTEMSEMVTKYLEILYKENPKSIGGKLPGEEIFYK